MEKSQAEGQVKGSESNDEYKVPEHSPHHVPLPAFSICCVLCTLVSTPSTPGRSPGFSVLPLSE